MKKKTSTTPDAMGFHYKFTLPNGKVKEFDLSLNRESLGLIPKKRASYPKWTQLSENKCTNCPLNESAHPRCPIAANLVDVIDFFKDALSYEEVDVEITTESRTYKKHAALQHALSSMIGIFMVTSGCPILDKLRPLVATHLPFSSMEETTYRAVSMYVFAQFFLYKKGLKPDWDLKNLSKIYEEIQTVNICFRRRLAAVHIEDAGLNAIVHLDCYARFTNMLLLEEGLDQMEQYFQGYLKPDSDQ
jgi:hypothetical protein